VLVSDYNQCQVISQDNLKESPSEFNTLTEVTMKCPVENTEQEEAEVVSQEEDDLSKEGLHN
jgi:hypothetical protein